MCFQNAVSPIFMRNRLKSYKTKLIRIKCRDIGLFNYWGFCRKFDIWDSWFAVCYTICSYIGNFHSQKDEAFVQICRTFHLRKQQFDTEKLFYMRSTYSLIQSKTIFLFCFHFISPLVYHFTIFSSIVMQVIMIIRW